MKGAAVMLPHPTYVALVAGQSAKTLWMHTGCMTIAVWASPDPTGLSLLGSTVKLKLRLMMSGNRMPPTNSKSVTVSSVESPNVTCAN